MNGEILGFSRRDTSAGNVSELGGSPPTSLLERESYFQQYLFSNELRTALAEDISRKTLV